MLKYLQQSGVAIGAVSLLAFSPLRAAYVAVDFGTEQQTTPTAVYTSAQIPETIAAGGWQNFTGDWSNNGLTLPTGTTPLSAYWDASVTWKNTNTSSPSSPYRGYLDDGSYNNVGSGTSWAIEISGLDAWMAANGSSEWRLVLLRSSDKATVGFRDVSIHTGTTSELTSAGFVSSPSALWASDPVTNSVVDNWPNGGTSDTITNGAFISTGGTTAISETNVFLGDSDAFIIRDTGKGNGSGMRGSIAGFILYTVPEPSTTLAAGLALGVLALRRSRSC